MTTPTASPSRGQLAALLLILGVATALRFSGLDRALRHPPHVDEEPFVRFALGMLTRGDLDHRYYQYPGLFLYLLAGVFGLLGQPIGADAYLAARTLCAVFSLASVGLVFWLGRTLFGTRAGLVAAALLAVSPLEVRTCHMVRPDVVLESFTLLALLAFARLGPGLRGDLVAGATLGAATAVKFSGVLLAPSYLLARLRAGRAGWTRPVLAGAASLIAFALVSPYTFLNARGGVRGAAYQVGWHYASEHPDLSYLSGVRDYGLVFLEGLGWAGLGLVAAACVLDRRRWREWGFLAILPICAIGVLSTSPVHRDRLVLLAMGALAVLAALGFERLAARWRQPARIVLVLALAFPLASAARYASNVSQPITRDLALDWADAHLPAGARVLLTSAADLGLDPDRYRILRIERLDERSWRAAIEADFVATGPFDDHALVRRLRLLERVLPPNPDAGLRVEWRAPPDELRVAGGALPLATARLAASQAAADAERVRDGDPASAWHADGDDAWLEVELAQPQTVTRVEVTGNARELHLEAASAQGSWQRIPAIPGFGGRGRSVLLIEPAPVLKLRLRGPAGWDVAELALFGE